MKRPDSRQGIHIATRQDHPDHKNTRLCFGEYFADVLYDAKSGIGYWIVQKVGSAAIIYWGQEDSFEVAQACAKRYLEELMRQGLGISVRLEA